MNVGMVLKIGFYSVRWKSLIEILERGSMYAVPSWWVIIVCTIGAAHNLQEIVDPFRHRDPLFWAARRIDVVFDASPFFLVKQKQNCRQDCRGLEASF